MSSFPIRHGQACHRRSGFADLRQSLVGKPGKPNFQCHPLVDALAAGAFDLHRNSGIFLLEILGEALRDFDIDCCVINNLALFNRRLDQ
jgi:hypothetical protein